MMSGLNSRQKETLKEFCQILDLNDQQLATQYLKGANWNIDHAINSYYDNPPKNPPKNIDNSEKLFNNYKDEDKNMIGPENIERLCEDIGISPVEIEILIIVFYFKPKQQVMLVEDIIMQITFKINMFAFIFQNQIGEFSKEEFIQGLKSMNCNSIEDLKDAIKKQKQNLLNDKNFFTNVYNFTFTFSLSQGKSLHYETAIELWGLFYAQKFKLFDKWIEFIKVYTNLKKQQNITKDQWEMFDKFVQQYGQDSSLENYDENMAWPSLFDEFVEYFNSNQ